MTFISFFAGVNYNEQEGGNSYIYEIFGFLLIFFLCVLERKSQIWLSNKFGYVGSTYEKYKGKIILQVYEPNLILSNEISNRKTTGNFDLIKEVEEESELQKSSSKMEKLIENIKDDLVKGEGESSEESKEGEDEGDQEEIELSAFEIYEMEKKKSIKKILNMENLLSISKVFRVILFVATVLISLLTSFYKLNVWGGIILLSVAIFSFTRVQFKNVKWYSLILSTIFVCQYMSALSNLNQQISPSIFPFPFNNRTIQRPLPLPIFREFGYPITRPNPTTDDPHIVPTEWAFYLGFIISSNRLSQLWIDMLAIVIMNYYFLYFYSASYELDMNLNIQETALTTLTKLNKSLSESRKASKKDSFEKNL